VLYLSDTELRELGIPADQLWRVVRLEVKKGGDWISWLHEREWRCRGDFELPSSIQAVFVRTTKEAERLTSLIREDPKSFKCKPRSVIPFTVICQGLLR
jgi:hypothetical protein